MFGEGRDHTGQGCLVVQLHAIVAWIVGVDEDENGIPYAVARSLGEVWADENEWLEGRA